MEFSPITIGAITAAFIAGIISLLGLVISKENKTSEFRQQWIDSLREEISDFLGKISSKRASIMIFQETMKNLSNKEKNDFILKISTEIKEASTVYWKICLRLNPKEHMKLQTALNSLNAASGQMSQNLENLQPLQEDLVKEVKDQLKKEWERVKKGEPFFRITKWSLVLIIISILISANYQIRIKKPLATTYALKAQKQISSAQLIKVQKPMSSAQHLKHSKIIDKK